MKSKKSFQISSPSGLNVHFHANGFLKHLEKDRIFLNLFPGNELEGGLTQVYLRLRQAQGGYEFKNEFKVTPLLGPQSPCHFFFNESQFFAQGLWEGIEISLALVLAHDCPAWFWQLELKNVSQQPMTVDLVYSHDLALAVPEVIKSNEYFVSQYLDYHSLNHPHCGVVLAARQNLIMEQGHPWALLGSLRQGVSFSNDALQFYGYNRPKQDIPQALHKERLAGQVRQHEHSLGVIQDAPLYLEPQAVVPSGFFGLMQTHHSEATSAQDLKQVDQVLSLPESKFAFSDAFFRQKGKGSERIEDRYESHFSRSLCLSTQELDSLDIKKYWPNKHRLIEKKGSQLHSFFTQECTHVVMKAKERDVLRPHGLIMRTGDLLLPEVKSLTTTVGMTGIFHSLVTEGNVNLNRVISPTHGYLNFFQSYGQRIFVEIKDHFYLLELPSAFSMSPQSCRWIYKYQTDHQEGVIEIQSGADTNQHQLTLQIKVLQGPALKFLLSQRLEGNQLKNEECSSYLEFKPTQEEDILKAGNDELLFYDGNSRGLPFHCWLTKEGKEFAFYLSAGEENSNNRDMKNLFSGEGKITHSVKEVMMTPPAQSPLCDDVLRIQESLPWMQQNAVIHFLAPRGLEQYVAGAWGTRDVSQGPVELLRALGEHKAWRNLLLDVFAAQNSTGYWPQWFMFFSEQKFIRADQFHSDVVFWPLLALAEYLLDSRDHSILDEKINYFDQDSQSQNAKNTKEQNGVTLRDHVEKALEAINKALISQTPVIAFGKGDWDDSMAPVDPEMSKELCSSWTVTLQYQTLTTLAQALKILGIPDWVDSLEDQARKVKDFFQEHLIVNETIAGFLRFRQSGTPEVLLHPSDDHTGIKYRLIPFVHAILSELLTPQQAQHHLEQIREHLVSPDGSRLSDRPLPYKGGKRKMFDRAESSAFFGREIGLMYNHAHLRYVQSLAFCGLTDAFFSNLNKSHALGFCAHLNQALPRQLNCYYSSSDAVFPDRYKAYDWYDRINKDEIPFEGGWRIYSSGAGLFVRLVHDYFLGLRYESDYWAIDPVIPPALSGLKVEAKVRNKCFDVEYVIGSQGNGLKKITLEGQELSFERMKNPYRLGGGKIKADDINKRCPSDQKKYKLVIEID